MLCLFQSLLSFSSLYLLLYLPLPPFMLSRSSSSITCGWIPFSCLGFRVMVLHMLAHCHGLLGHLKRTELPQSNTCFFSKYDQSKCLLMKRLDCIYPVASLSRVFFVYLLVRSSTCGTCHYAVFEICATYMDSQSSLHKNGYWRKDSWSIIPVQQPFKSWVSTLSPQVQFLHSLLLFMSLHKKGHFFFLFLCGV